MKYRPTPAQRELVQRLLRQAELHTPSFTLLHKGVWIEARLPAFDTDLGKPLDQMLAELSFQQTSRLIDVLNAR